MTALATQLSHVSVKVSGGYDTELVIAGIVSIASGVLIFHHPATAESHRRRLPGHHRSIWLIAGLQIEDLGRAAAGRRRVGAAQGMLTAKGQCRLLAPTWRVASVAT
jgi:hypothetical protein